MAEVALNLVALLVGGVISLWCLLTLQFVGYDAITRLAWHRRGLFLGSSPEIGLCNGQGLRKVEFYTIAEAAKHIPNIRSQLEEIRMAFA